MFGFKSKEDVKKELLEEIRKEDEDRKAVIAKAEQKAREDVQAKIKAEEAARAEEAEKMKSSAEPWVVIKAMVQDPEKGIRIELDWNDAFVKHLRANGYTGTDDTTIIQRYIAVLSKQVADDMAEDMINEHE